MDTDKQSPKQEEKGGASQKPEGTVQKPEQKPPASSTPAQKPSAPAQPAPGQKPPAQAPPAQKPVIRHILRVAGVDIDGTKTIKRSIRKVTGVGIPLANAIVNVSGVGNKITGDLTEAEVKKIEQILEDPVKAGIPVWMVNRQKDYETGEDKHIHGVKIPIYKREDVARLQRIRSYRGIRHALGLKLRGQRTRSTGRGGKSIGVVRKKGGTK